jgi:hypothetical protein
LMRLGAPSCDAPDYDLTGVFVGSEGTLGVATEVTLRIVKKPEAIQVLLAAFDSITGAALTVSDIIANAILPAAMEIMDRLSIQSAEAAVHPNYPLCDGTIARSDGQRGEERCRLRPAQAAVRILRHAGLITEVTFRLHSITRQTASLTATAATADPLDKLLLVLLDSQLSIQSMQLRTDIAGFALDVRVAAHPAVLSSQQDGLAGVAKSEGLRAEASTGQKWAAREQLFAPSAFVFKATMLPTEIAPAEQAILDLGGSTVVQATGILTGSVPGFSSPHRLAGLRAQLEAAGGSLTLLHAPAGTNFDRWGTLPDSWPVMRAVKQQFDPHGILNPAAFLERSDESTGTARRFNTCQLRRSSSS